MLQIETYCNSIIGNLGSVKDYFQPNYPGMPGYDKDKPICYGDHSQTIHTSVDNLSKSFGSLSSAATDAISVQMAHMAAGYASMCASKALPIKDAVGTIAGIFDFIDKLARGEFLAAIVEELNNFVASNIKMVATEMISRLQHFEMWVAEKIAAIAEGVGLCAALELLRMEMNLALGSLGSIIGCGKDMLNALNKLPDEVVAMAPVLDTARKVVNKAASIIPADNPNFVNVGKNLLAQSNNFDGRLAGLKEGLNNVLDTLN